MYRPMTKYTFALFAFFGSLLSSRADLVLEQQAGDTNHLQTAIMKVHDDRMRLDDPADHFSVIVNLKTRDSYTLLTNKTYLFKFGSEIRWEMDEEKKYSHGTNDMDLPAAPARDTGKSEMVNGRPAEIFTWSGAHGLTETLWVDEKFPNYDAIRPELFKIDEFNDSGPHRNGQPALSVLPGMVVKSESTAKDHTITTTLVSVKVEPVDASLFQLPPDYKEFKRPPKAPRPKD
jgi:hypothetical protein